MGTCEEFKKAVFMFIKRHQIKYEWYVLLIIVNCGCLPKYFKFSLQFNTL